jgi:hypothetical protein
MNYTNLQSTTLNLDLMEEKPLPPIVYAHVLNVIKVKGVMTGKNLCGGVSV